ncbi:MAG: DNRLRE domain-containing protein [Promethearchaeota archaeon]|nr:MAG: DNRLRE domain-containing protein [Candidatus Lokiarchaeota archaeon]
MISRSYMYAFSNYSVILIILLFLPQIPIEEQISITAIENATIDEYNPDSNFSADTDLKIGYWILDKYGGSQLPEESFWISYIKFDLSDAPTNFVNAELKLEFLFVEAAELLEIYETSSLWSEYAITWNNAPSNEDLLAESYVYEENVYSFDVKSIVEENAGYWSICLALNDSNWMLLASRKCYSEYEPPQIIYYTTTIYIPLISNFGLILILLVTIIGFLAFYNHWIKKREIK